MSSKTSIEWTATINQDGTVTPGATWSPIRARIRPNAVEIAKRKGTVRADYDPARKLSPAAP